MVKNQRKYLGEQRFGSYYYYDLKGLDESMKSRLINTNRFPMALPHYSNLSYHICKVHLQLVELRRLSKNY